MSSLIENGDLLNFTYLTAIFYNYVFNSNKNFKILKSKQQKKINSAKSSEINNEYYSLKNEFETMNNENHLKYFENLSIINENDIQSNKNKLIIIKSIFGKNFETRVNDELFLKLSQKINFSMLSDKYTLVEFISNQTINYLFEIYELFFKILKNMKETHFEKIQKLNADNLLSEDKLNAKNKKILEQVINLKNEIEKKNQIINKKEEENKKISIFESTLKESRGKINILQKEIDESKKEAKEKITNLTNKLNESEKEVKEKITNLTNKLNESEKESKKKITILTNKLNESEKESKKK